MNIYVGNLSYNTTDDGLKGLFEGYGEVVSVNVIKDKMTGQSRGFAFIEMSADDQAQAAIDGLNGQEFDGRQLRINVARKREERR